jgi:hypothetical protein
MILNNNGDEVQVLRIATVVDNEHAGHHLSFRGLSLGISGISYGETPSGIARPISARFTKGWSRALLSTSNTFLGQPFTPTAPTVTMAPEPLPSSIWHNIRRKIDL